MLSGKDMLLETLILYFASELGMNISIFADLSDALWEIDRLCILCLTVRVYGLFTIFALPI